MKTNLKKKNVLLIAIVMITVVMIQIPTKTIAQFTLPSISEQPAVSATQIQNTGCDMQQLNSTSGYMFVAVCDGSPNPSFTWQPTGGILGSASIVPAPGGGTITDPDIVLTHDGLNAIIIFIQNGHCYYESWRYTNAVPFIFKINQLPIMLSSPLMTASCPNSDIGCNKVTGIDYVAATWDTKPVISTLFYTVMGAVGQYSGTSSAGSYIFSTSFAVTSGANSYTPDVCINSYNNNNVNFNYVTFGYVQGNLTGTHGIYYRGQTWATLNSSQTFSTSQTLAGATVNYPNTLRNPRVAASLFPVAQTDFALIAEYHTITNNQQVNQIVVKTSYNGTSNPAVIINNSTTNITNYNNSLPVITYSGDEIIASWVYSGPVSLNNTTSSILSRQLDRETGTVLTANTSLYSVINDHYSVNYGAPSVAGKHNLNGNTLYVMSTPSSLDAVFSPNVTCTSCRELSINNNDENTETKFYPNPVSSDLTIDFGNDASWIGATVEIMNITGQLVNKFTIDNLSSSINVSNLRNGLYIVRTTSTNQITLTKKIMIQH